MWEWERQAKSGIERWLSEIESFERNTVKTKGFLCRLVQFEVFKTRRKKTPMAYSLLFFRCFLSFTLSLSIYTFLRKFLSIKAPIRQNKRFAIKLQYTATISNAKTRSCVHCTCPLWTYSCKRMWNLSTTVLPVKLFLLQLHQWPWYQSRCDWITCTRWTS